MYTILLHKVIEMFQKRFVLSCWPCLQNWQSYWRTASCVKIDWHLFRLYRPLKCYFIRNICVPVVLKFTKSTRTTSTDKLRQIGTSVSLYRFSLVSFVRRCFSIFWLAYKLVSSSRIITNSFGKKLPEIQWLQLNWFVSPCLHLKIELMQMFNDFVPVFTVSVNFENFGRFF